ncbi:MAG: class IV adenylate cyclase [Vicinamibacterales bacterium]|jgi:predicted adenylyl cyclase CyaB|nr:class IV adenylate cyclase [Vicinamibacterales bacterium]
MRNLEIKAAVDSRAAVRRRLGGLDGATRHAILRQTDWYFRVPKGRLKLRVAGGSRNGELIAYVRPDRAEARTSEFQRLPATDAAGTRRLLERMLGASGCVRKRREVWLYRNARIHLDTVEGLGRFIEIEVVVTEGMAQARALMKELREVMGISAKDLIAGSYGELSATR